MSLFAEFKNVNFILGREAIGRLADRNRMKRLRVWHLNGIIIVKWLLFFSGGGVKERKQNSKQALLRRSTTATISEELLLLLKIKSKTVALGARPYIIYYRSTPRDWGRARMEIKIKFQPICGGRGLLCAWLALNEAVCHTQTRPTPNHSNAALLSSAPPSHHRCIMPVIISLPRHQWSTAAGLYFTPFCHLKSPQIMDLHRYGSTELRLLGTKSYTRREVGHFKGKRTWEDLLWCLNNMSKLSSPFLLG